MFIAGQPRPHPKGMGHRRPQSFLGPATYDQLFWRRATKFGVEHVRSSVLLGGMPRLHPNGVWLQHLQHCWDPHKCAQTVWPRPTKFGTITHVGSSVFLGASHAPITGEGPTQRTLLHGLTVWEVLRNNPMHADRTRCYENIGKVSTNADARCVCGK